MVENPNPLAGNPIGARVRVGARQRVHDDRSDSRQPELTGQHQSVRTGAGDADLIHLAQLTSARVGAPTTRRDVVLVTPTAGWRSPRPAPGRSPPEPCQP